MKIMMIMAYTVWMKKRQINLKFSRLFKGEEHI